MTALFRTRLEQHGSGNLGDAVGGKKGESSNLLGASLPCSQQSASINKGLAAPRSILIFKLTAERIRAFPAPSRDRKRQGGEREKKRKREAEEFTLELARESSMCSLTRICTYIHMCVCVHMCVAVPALALTSSRTSVYTFG